MQERLLAIDDFQPQAVILCSGDYPTHPLPLGLLANAPRVVCCDSAAYAFIKRGGVPWRIVGDCDSILSPRDDEERRILQQYEPRILRIAEQDTNDLTKAVRFIWAHGLTSAAIVGATGKREDHTLGNIALSIEYMRMGIDARIYTDYGVFIPCRGDITFRAPIPEGFVADDDRNARRQKSTQVSIFNINAHGLSADGLRYPLSDFTSWWAGTLNEAIASPFHIHAEGEYIVYVEYSEERNME